MHGDDQVVLQSQDGQDFKVEVQVAKKSETIKNLIEDAGVDAPIPLPNISGKTLAKLVEFMKYDVEHPFSSDRALLAYLEEHWSERALPTTALLDVVLAVNYLDIRSQVEGDVLKASLRLYGDRLFGQVELDNLKRIADDAAYNSYAQVKLLPKDLQKIIVKQILGSMDNTFVDRIFLDNSPDRRFHAIEATPLDVVQIIAYIVKNQTESAAALHEPLRNALGRWKKDFADKIHFGPMPIEWARWPGHCSLDSDANYNMYSDATPDDRYRDNGDGTITDVCTRLTWEQTPSTPPAPLQQSQNHCVKLTKANFTDWRSPTRIELQSIVNYGATNPALNAVFGERNVRYWSSTAAVGYENQVWTVNFDGGHVLARARTENHRMRCVRGERGGAMAAGAKNHYTYAATSHTVTDNFTGAVWQRGVVDEGRDDAAAQEYCTNLELEGRGWTLPTVKALSTLIDVGLGAPRIDRAAFPATPERWFWSRSPRVGNPILAWDVNFDSGSVFGNHVVNDYRARCVR
jgi:hypothetical protein